MEAVGSITVGVEFKSVQINEITNQLSKNDAVAWHWADKIQDWIIHSGIDHL